jgi:hypothetical protein
VKRGDGRKTSDNSSHEQSERAEQVKNMLPVDLSRPAAICEVGSNDLADFLQVRIFPDF